MQHLSKHEVPIAIATSSPMASVKKKTAHLAHVFEVGKYFQHLVSSPDDPEVKRNKPHPDVYQVCSSRFPDPPSHPSKVVVFEDSPIGAEGALAAGMQVVMVHDERWCEKKLSNINATMKLTSLEHFQPELFGLPAFY